MKASLWFILFFCALHCTAQNHARQRLKGIETYVQKNYFSKTPGLESIATEGIALAKELKEYQIMANLCKMIGVHYYFSGQYEQALSNYLKAIDLYQKQKNPLGEASVYNELGTLYRKHKRYNEAIDLFNKAESIGKSMHDTSLLATALNNRGIVYETQGKLNLALKQYQTSLQLYLKISDKVGESYCLENIGGIYMLENNFQMAEIYLKKSIDIRKKEGLQQACAMGFHYLGELYQNTNSFQLSNAMFDSCIRIAKAIEYPDLIQRAYFSKAKNFKLMGETAKALNYFEMASSLKDSLFDAEKNRVLSELQTQYELDVKNKENSLLKQGNELNRQKLKSNRLLIALIVLVFFISTAFGIIFYKRKQKLVRANTLKVVKEAEQIQRTRISHDLHDHVGAQLSYVVSNLDMARIEIEENKLDPKRIDAINDMSKQAINTLRETVWALNNENISVESFADKFKLYALKMTDMNEQIALHFSESIQGEAVLMPNAALHIFRICQEAFSNALRHGKPSQISIEISSNSKYFFYFKLSDNGMGFVLNQPDKNGHYGMINMQSRAEEIGAVLEIESEIGQGTTICLTLQNNTYV